MNEWATLFEAVDAMYGEISKLLRESDKRLATHGCTPWNDEFSGKVGKHLDQPGMWTPGWLSRRYAKSGVSDHELFISILLRNRADDDLVALDEVGAPVITAGVLRGTPDKQWVAKVWGWNRQGCRLDGTPTNIPLEKKHGGTVDVFAWPLEKIENPATLEEFVITPLIALSNALEKRCSE